MYVYCDICISLCVYVGHVAGQGVATAGCLASEKYKTRVCILHNICRYTYSLHSAPVCCVLTADCAVCATYIYIHLVCVACTYTVYILRMYCSVLRTIAAVLYVWPSDIIFHI